MLLLTFFALVASLFFFWQYRFEAVPGAQRITLADLRGSSILGPGVAWTQSGKGLNLSLRIADEAPNPIALLHFPTLRPVCWLHVRFQISANNLVPGRETWNDGRCIMEWHTPGKNDEFENDQFTSVRGNQNSGIVECVLRPNNAPADPVLRIENIGVKGELIVSEFEGIPLQERVLWRIGRWFLIFGWIGWAVFWIRPTRGLLVRAVLAGIVWLLMGIYFVVPGPWKITRSFGQPFQIQMATGSQIMQKHVPSTLESTSDPESRSKKLVSIGKVEGKVDLILQIKMLFASIRPLLHSLLLMVPTVLIACLVGQRPAIQLMAVLALSIEAAQVAFGYGFDRLDVFDLFADSVGILIGIILYRWVQRSSHPLLIRLVKRRHEGGAPAA